MWALGVYGTCTPTTFPMAVKKNSMVVKGWVKGVGVGVFAHRGTRFEVIEIEGPGRRRRTDPGDDQILWRFRQ